jgi:O-antigen biosynthesis protein
MNMLNSNTWYRNFIRLTNFLRHLSKTLVQDGWRHVFYEIQKKFKTASNNGLFSKIKIVDFYSFVLNEEIGSASLAANIPAKTINWIIPPFGFGSGGHLNIFRFIYFLEKEGFDCRVIIVGEPQPLNSKLAREQISTWFFKLQATVFIGIETAPPAHISVATSWQTAYAVKRFQSTNHRCYFVQDFEPSFYAAGSEYAWAEETYKFGFLGITAGTWLKNKLNTEYGMVCHSFGFSYDRDLYEPLPKKDPAIKRIFFYARPPTQRRAFELGMLVLDEVVRRLPEVKVVFAGWDVSAYEINYEHLNAGVVSVDKLPDLYSQCDAALVLSFTNLSLLPLEIMACGTPVVSNLAPCTEWLLNDQNCLLAKPTVEALADALCSVISDPKEQIRLRSAGLATAHSTSWEAETARVGLILTSLSQRR